jgi:hypothetical protein
MPDQNESCKGCDESLKQAAIEFLHNSGSLESAAAELGDFSADLRAGKRKRSFKGKSAKTANGLERLRAENEALRTQVLSLQIQWEMLKSNLGMLSTTVCSRD